MGTKRPSNEDIQIGSIFKCVARDECGSSCDFYQVVGKRGKTLVELRAIRRECFLDERCKPGLGEVRVRPLPGEFKEGCKPFTVAACRRSEIDGKAILASTDEDTRGQIINRIKFRKKTDNTIMTRDALEAELLKVKEQGKSE